MHKEQCQVAVIGGGPAGMAAALAAFNRGASEVVIIERDYDLGGILPQCVHDGFGLMVMKERLTGPEYAEVYKNRVREQGIKALLDTMVLDIEPSQGFKEPFTLTAVNSASGVFQLQAQAVVLAMGCRERTRAQIMIPGSRPAGVFTAGTAQRLVNIEGVLPGKRAVILGSGDIGLIMARRLHLEGVAVEGVYEIQPQPNGLTRNVVQCLEDYGIPLHLQHTITEIRGHKRVEGVTVAGVDHHRQPIPGTERRIDCDTVILSVGLIPENELSEKAGAAIDRRTSGPQVDGNMETNIPGLFACGNVVNVYDLVDYVTMTAETAGRGAADYVLGMGSPGEKTLKVTAGANVQFVVPQTLHPHSRDHKVNLYLRVQEPVKNAQVKVLANGKVLSSKRHKIVKPPEMVVVEIKAGELAELAADEIVVSVAAVESRKGGKQHD